LKISQLAKSEKAALRATICLISTRRSIERNRWRMTAAVGHIIASGFSNEIAPTSNRAGTRLPHALTLVAYSS